MKVDILETLLNESDGAGLSADDQALAQQMIEDSDNDAATALWYAAGGAAGLAAYNAKAGLTRTTPSPCVECVGFPWPGWGLTTTVPYDQITLLKRIILPSSLLTSAERSYALSLLENVTPDQAWGISGGVPAGVTVALKNGWLPLNDADTDWQINSEGWVSGDGRDYLISVLTTGNPDEQYGIDTVSAAVIPRLDSDALIFTMMPASARTITFGGSQDASGDRLPAAPLVNAGPQELPDLLGGLGCLGGAEQELVDVRQALADLKGDVDPGFGCRRGQAFGVAEQQVGRADLNEQRREPGQ